MFAALVPWLTWINVEAREWWVTNAALSFIALSCAIPPFRRPFGSIPKTRSHRDRTYGFSSGMMVVGAVGLMAGLFAESVLTAHLGAVALWAGAVQRMTVIDWDFRASHAEAAEAASAESGAVR